METDSESDEEEGWGLGPPESFAKALSSASKCYDSMLADLHAQNPEKYPHLSILSIPAEHFLHYKKVFAKFAKYIYDSGLLFGTCNGYVSTIKMYIFSKCPLSDVCIGSFYSNLRNEIKRRYVIKSSETAKPVSSTSDPLTLDHLSIICRILFERGTRIDAENRTIAVVLWQALGRINELGSMRIETITYYSNFQCLSLRIVRGKTHKVHNVLMFAHRADMYTCPLHTIGTHLALSTIADYLFVDLRTVEESSRINAMLRGVQKQHLQESGADMDALELTQKKYTSKSGRSGGSTAANEHPEVQTQDILPRGGWDLTGIQTIFTYICGTSRVDGKVGRVLSGWPHAMSGGISPHPAECLTGEERSLFNWYASEIFGAAPLTDAVRLVVCACLVRHFPQLLREQPAHPLLYKMLNCCQGVGAAKLLHWATIFGEQFKLRNQGNMDNNCTSTEELFREELKLLRLQMEQKDAKIDKMIDLVSQLLKRDRGKFHSASDSEQSSDGASNDNISSTALSSKRTLTLHGDLITQHFPVQHRVHTTRTTSSSNNSSSSTFSASTHIASSTSTPAPISTPVTTPTITTNPLPPDLLHSRADIFIHQFFLQWYEDKLYLRTHSGSHENRVFARLWNMHKYLCRFVPESTTIKPIPDSTATTYLQREQWRADMLQLAFAVEQATMKFCTREHQKEKAAAPIVAGKKTRQKKLKSTIESAYRRINHVYLTNPQLLPPLPAGFIDNSGAAGAGPMMEEN